MSPSVSELCTAVVVVFDSATALPECLAALKREGARVLVVDNASTDGSPEIAETNGARVIRNERNEGYGRANNIGVRAAETELVLIVNPDVILDPGAATALVDAAARYPEAGMLAPRLVEPDGRVFFQPRSLLAAYLKNPSGVLRLPEGDCSAPFLSGACFLVRRDVFMKVGGFDEAIFLFYEDDDLCRRMTDAGYSLIHVDGATARHGRGRSSAPQRGRIYKGRWHQAWSQAYVSRKYSLPNPAPVMAGMNLLKTLAACLTFNRRLIERYGGSAAGAFAFVRGRSALAREGLDRP